MGLILVGDDTLMPRLRCCELIEGPPQSETGGCGICGWQLRCSSSGPSSWSA